MVVRPSRFVAVILGGLALVSAAVAGTRLATPGRSLTQAGEIVPLALTGRKIAFGVGVSPAECRVKLWSITKGSVTFGLPKTPSCTIETSTGSGVFAVSVASTRVVWLAYTGGNIREWFLFTATAEKPTPKRLRFVSADVDGPAPVVLGPGTALGIPYAVRRQVVFLGDDGVPLFTTTLADPVRLITAGPGPDGIRVAALTSAGHIVALTRVGSPAADDIVPGGAVRALRVFSGGIAYQLGNTVRLVRGGDVQNVTLPPGAVMVDAPASRILYERAGDLWAATTHAGSNVLLADGSPAQPVHGQLETTGLAWTSGATVYWRAGPPPSG